MAITTAKPTHTPTAKKNQTQHHDKLSAESYCTFESEQYVPIPTLVVVLIFSTSATTEDAADTAVLVLDGVVMVVSDLFCIVSGKVEERLREIDLLPKRSVQIDVSLKLAPADAMTLVSEFIPFALDNPGDDFLFVSTTGPTYKGPRLVVSHRTEICSHL